METHAKPSVELNALLEKYYGNLPAANLLKKDIPQDKNMIFNAALKIVFEHEGFYSNDKDDKGGATKYGISLRLLKDIGLDVDGDGLITYRDILALDPESAAQIYKQYFWLSAYNQLDPVIAVKVFDLSVNMGAKQSHVILQRAVRAASHITLKQDGIIGRKTHTSVNECDTLALLSAIRANAASFYRFLVYQHHPYKKYLSGWLNRAYF